MKNIKNKLSNIFKVTFLMLTFSILSNNNVLNPRMMNSGNKRVNFNIKQKMINKDRENKIINEKKPKEKNKTIKKVTWKNTNEENKNKKSTIEAQETTKKSKLENFIKENEKKESSIEDQYTTKKSKLENFIKENKKKESLIENQKDLVYIELEKQNPESARNLNKKETVFAESFAKKIDKLSELNFRVNKKLNDFIKDDKIQQEKLEKLKDKYEVYFINLIYKLIQLDIFLKTNEKTYKENETLHRSLKIACENRFASARYILDKICLILDRPLEVKNEVNTKNKIKKL